MGELETSGEYEGKVTFNVVAKADYPDFDADCEKYKLGEHGLVVLSPSGEALAALQSHSYGKEKIVEAISQALN